MLQCKWRGLIYGLTASLLIACQPAAQPAVPIKDNRALGPADAPVTVIEYGDFGCVTCRHGTTRTTSIRFTTLRH